MGISLSKIYSRDMKKIFLAVVGLLTCSLSNAQTFNFDNHTSSVETFVQGFNDQNYGQMKKPIGFTGKVLISKKRLKAEFSSFYDKYGELKIDTIIYSSIYNGNTELKSETHPHKRIFMTFNFSNKGKFQGFGFGYPTFVYKQNPPITTNLSKTKKYQIIDSIVVLESNRPAPINFNGCILISKKDSIVYKKNVGYSDFESHQPLNDTSMFLLASCSKQFTAVAIMILHEEGQLNIKDKVKEHLPNFPYDNITIENLLTHTSGLPSYFPLIKKYGDKSNFNTNTDVLNLLIDHKQELRFIPNSRFEYSNTGYVILSLIIESASNQSYKDFLESKVFQPLSMNHTLVYNRRKENNSIPNYALGYVYSAEHKKYILPDSLSRTQYVSYMDGITGDDGISSCVLDLQKWMLGLRNNTLITSKSFKSTTSSHTLANGKKTNYGFGFITRKGEGIEDIIYHTGSWPGYSTMMIEAIESNYCVIILSNTSYHNLSFLADEILYTLKR